MQGRKIGSGHARYLREQDNGTGSGGGAPADWRAGLPEDLRASPALKDVKDVAGLAKAFVDTKALVGGSLRIPTPEAGPEARKAFIDKLHEKVPDVVYVPGDPEARKEVEAKLWDVLGKPAKPEGYTLDGVDLGGVQLDAAELQKQAAVLGLTKGQFQTLVKGIAGAKAEEAKTVKGWQDAMRQEWGAAHDERKAAILAIAQKLQAPAADIERLKAGTLPPEQMRVWWAVAQGLGGEGREIGNQQGGSAALAPAEAQARIAEIRGNPVLYNGSNPAEAERLSKELARLYPLAYPDLAKERIGEIA